MTALAKVGRELVANTSSPVAPVQTHLTPPQQKRLEKWLRLLEPMRAFREGRLATLRFVDGHEVRTIEEMEKWVAEQSGVSPALVHKVDCIFREGGVNALEPKKDPRRGRSLLFERRPKLQNFVRSKWKEGLNIAHIADTVRREWGGPELPYEGECPSYSAIRAEILRWPAPLRDYPRLTKRKWESKYAPYLNTGRGQYTRPNEVWISDHRLYDVLVANDCFADVDAGAAIRLWRTCVQDMRSRLITGSVWSVNPSSRTIARALRQGIRRWGKPGLFYLDNGKDYRKIGAGARSGSLLLNANNMQEEEDDLVPRGLLARLDIRVSYCTPYHPQAKPIESYFNFESQRFDPIFSRHGYTGRRPEVRTDFCREQEKQHSEFLAGKREKSPLYAASLFMKLHAQFVEEFNHEHRHTGDGMDGRTPMEVMDELLPDAQRIIPDMSELEPLFWDVELRQVTNCKVRLNNASYSVAVDDLQGAEEMFNANGSVVAVHFDPEDPANAEVFENVPGGRRLAFLFSDDLAAQRRMTGETVKGMSIQRAKLRRATRDTWEIGVSSVPSSEIERLAERRGMEKPEHYSRPRVASPRRLALTNSPFVSDDAEKDRNIFDDDRED